METQSNRAEKELTFSSIIRFIKASFARISLYSTLAVIAAATILGGLMAFPIAKTNVYAAISFSYRGVEEGLAPDGTKLLVSDISNVEVLNSAISASGLSGMDVSALKERMSIKGIVSKETADKLSLAQGTINNQAELAKFLAENNSFATEYVIEIADIKKLKLNPEQAQILLGGIIASYENYFYNRYYRFSFSETSINIDRGLYDFIEIGDVIAEQTRRIKSVATLLALEAPNFTSFTSKLTFSDLLSQAQFVESVDIPRYYSFVLSNGVAVNPLKVDRYFDYQLAYFNSLIQQETRRGETLEKAVAEYAKYPIVVVGESKSSYGLEIQVPTAEYDKLVSQLTLTRAGQSYYESQVELILARKSQFAASAPLSNELMTESEQMLGSLNKASESLLKTAKDLTAEYYSSKAAGSLSVKASPTAKTMHLLNFMQSFFIISTAGTIATGVALLVSLIKQEKAKKTAQEAKVKSRS